MKVNFKQILVEASFDEFKEFDIAREFGNYIHSNTNDIGLDDTAREIYHSEGEIEISEEHAGMIAALVNRKECNYVAAFKKAILKQINC